MAKLIIPIGLPGSGKSFWTKENLGSDFTIFSSDDIREEIYGDANNQENPAKVFGIMVERTVDALKNDQNVYYDATNLSKKYRKHLINTVRGTGKEVEIIGFLFLTPHTTCITRQENRERKVPREVIYRMMEQFEPPYYDEGFNDIKIVDFYDEYYPELELNYILEILDAAIACKHENRHHYDDTIFEHCNKVAQYSNSKWDDGTAAVIARLHDIGKPVVKKYKRDGNASYYNHQNISAYFSLFFTTHLDVEGRLLIANVIFYHMKRYSYQDGLKFNSWFKTLPPRIQYYLQILMEADASDSR